jgi:hypothetical protein
VEQQRLAALARLSLRATACVHKEHHAVIMRS